MPTFALYTDTADPDAGHHVRAPGGYEWWYFDVEDERYDRRLIVELHLGCPFHPGYLRGYARYRRRPTRVRPPLPEQFPCVYVALYEGGQARWRCMTQFPPGTSEASPQRLLVRIGPNACRAVEGAIQLDLESVQHEQTLAGVIRFTPLLPARPLDRRFLPRRLTEGIHRWILANPLCTVEARMRISSASSSGPIDLRGLGYCDHYYGTAPLVPALGRGFHGRALLAGAAYAFQMAVADGQPATEQVQLIEATPQTMAEVEGLPVTADWSGRTPRRIMYPTSMAIGDVLQLHNPRLIEATGFSARLAYDAVCRGRSASALCQVVDASRLRRPGVRHAIEKSIDTQPTGASSSPAR